MTDASIGVLIVDGDAQFRQAVHDLIRDTADITVVGEAKTGKEAIELTRTRAPDIVLLDAGMLGANGLRPMQAFSASSPRSKVIVSGSGEQEGIVLSALRNGACGHLVKGENALAELLNAIRVVNRGGTYLSPRVAGQVLDAIIQGQRQRKASVGNGD